MAILVALDKYTLLKSSFIEAVKHYILKSVRFDRAAQLY